MPAIREYTNQIDTIRPNNSGMGAMADLANSQGRAGYYMAQQIKERGNDIAGAVKDVGRAAAEWYDENQTKMEISQANTLLTQKEMNYTKRWQETTAATDPNDASIGPKFLEEVKSDLDKSVEGAKTVEGRRWLQKQADSMYMGWFKQINADIATRSGQAIKDNVIKSMNTAGTIISQNPTALDRMLDQQTDAIKMQLASSPNLTEATRAQLGESLVRQMRGELVQRGIQTMMDANPEAGLAVLKSGKYAQDLSPDNYKQLEAYSTAVTKRQEVEAKARLQQQKEQRAAAFQQAQAQIFEKNVVVNDDGRVVVRPEFLKNAQRLATVDPSKVGEVRSMITWANTQIDRAAKGIEATDNPATVENFRARIFRGVDDPDSLSMAEVYQATARGELSDKSFRFFKDAVQKDYRDPKAAADYREFERVMKLMRTSFVKGGVFGSDDGGAGDRNFLRFRQDKWEEYRAARATGIPASKLLSTMAPESIIKDFNRYMLTPEQQMEAQAARMRGAASKLPDVRPPEGLAPSQFDQRFFGSENANKWDGKESMDELFKRLNGGK